MVITDGSQRFKKSRKWFHHSHIPGYWLDDHCCDSVTFCFKKRPEGFLVIKGECQG